ncbi:YciI family protein [Flavobacterium azooxidireducens]|uniref:YciI family protein n=1 Tax=Flavobacterium azooxidireducens TaxID=1871076 RepID=A0ABY4KIG1_9FLAO|nr:YciI family protein [Flavobacterium azooxidireducens]UPQ80631.1 YciI family protein [Flavobacterium azooxidireducens]
MKKSSLVLLLGTIFACNSTKTDTAKVVTSQKEIVKTNHETFSYQSGDTTYVMQKYFLVLLKKRKNRNHSKEEAAELQKQHMAHIGWLDKTGKISIAGPSDNHETVAGFLLFHTETMKEADSLANLDPAVKAGRLEVETLPWWAAKGSKLK